MAYNATYESGDIAEAAVNTVAVFFIVLANLAVVIVLLLMWNWGKKRFPM